MANSNKTDFRYELIWCGEQDKPKLQAVVKYLRDTFLLFGGAGAKLINHKEYTELVNKRKIDNSNPWWRIDKGQVGLIIFKSHALYIREWRRILSARTDFYAGWEACERQTSDK